MTRVNSPSAGLVPSTLPQGAPASAVLTELPTALRNIGLGAFLTGTVLDRAANGVITLQTGAGLFALKTTVPLPIGSSVTLQVQTAGSQLQAIVLSITPQGSPVQAPVTSPQSAGQSPAAASASGPAASPGPVTVDGPSRAPSTITATVIGPPGGPVPATISAPAASQAPAGTAATVGGAPFTAHVASTAEPAALADLSAPAASVSSAVQSAAYQRQLNAVPAPPTNTLPPATSPTPPAPVSLPGAHANLAATPSLQPTEQASVLLPSGTQIQVRLVPAGPPTVQTPPSPFANNVSTQSPGTTGTPQHSLGLTGTANSAALAATVVAHTPAGQAILDTPVGRLLAALPRTKGDIAPGTRLTLELVANERALFASRPILSVSGLLALAREWPALKDVLKLAQDAPTPDAHEGLARVLPKAGTHLGSQILAFLESAQSGAKAWLGDAVVRALTAAGGEKLMEQLDQDLREMFSTQRQPDGDWRMTIVPLLDGSDLRQVRFFERRKKRDEPHRKRDGSARFVVECEHSQLGALQLDGLMHEQRLDLIIRSQDPLPAEMERDILVLFGQTCTGINLNGQLFFQSVPVFPVNPADEFSREPVQVSV